MWTGATAADLALFFFPIFPHTSRRITLQTPNLRYTHDPLSPTSEARAVYVALQHQDRLLRLPTRHLLRLERLVRGHRSLFWVSSALSCHHYFLLFLHP
jgi:hypothetical protein